VEEALREAARARDEFLAALAHELRDPLDPLLNALHVLDLQAPQSAELRWVIEIMNRQLRRMTRLIDDLSDVARISGHGLELRRERASLAGIVQEAVDASRPLLEAKGHKTSIDLPREPVWIEADRMRLAQAISNLLGHAARHTPPGGRISLQARARGDELVLSVRDSGTGIPADVLPRIFEPFVRRDPAGGGLGIELALVRHVVELHGGAVEARSHGPGTGSEFLIRLPLGASAPGERAGAPASALRVLIVDDNRDSTQAMGKLLRIRGHDVRTAHDGPEAVRLADEFRPQVAVLDIGLPELSGYEVARSIRRKSWGKGMVLIALTGREQDEDRRRSIEAGFDHHMVKPVEPSILLTLLARYAGGDQGGPVAKHPAGSPDPDPDGWVRDLG
jgi:CheY-like chemotaxis protein